MAYVALKPCCFAGQRFKIGECVPDDLIHPGAVKNLVNMGLIAEQNGTTKTEPTETKDPSIIVNFHVEEGDMPLELTADGLQSIFDVLASTADEAVPIVKQMTDGNALFLLNQVDGRKSIKTAAMDRAKEINQVGEDDEAGEA